MLKDGWIKHEKLMRINTTVERDIMCRVEWWSFVSMGLTSILITMKMRKDGKLIDSHGERKLSSRFTMCGCKLCIL